MSDPSKFVIGISGASRVIYGVRLLDALKALPVETHLVMTRTAEVTLAHETDLKVAAVRALADVVMKERRRLVLLTRETPLHAIHLRNMTRLAEMGVIIAPPTPAFYNRPKTLDDVIDHTVGRVLDLFELDSGKVRRWGEAAGPGR